MKKILIIFIFTILAVGFVYSAFNFFQTETAKAGSEHNVSGYAWSENIGWISFNNTSGGGTVSYGVNIDQTTGNFSGYAWSENIGWISFAPSGPYPGAPDYSARLNTVSNQVTGWARALAYGDGWDGWIKMAGTASDGSSYGVSRSECDLVGYAWGSDVVGWIKFNGSNYKIAATSCENQPPSATNLNVTQPDYCLVGWASAIFSWIFSDPDSDTQSAYQIQVDNNSNFSSPEVDSGEIISTSNSYATQAGKLSFNTTYYWRLMVWDSKGMASSWISGVSFATPRHAYPYIDFTWIPQNPTVDESTQFTDQSTVYGGSVKSSWYWTFQNGSPSFSAIQNPLVKFLSTGAKSITLKVTDSDGFNCTGQKTLNTLLKLPDWKEIAPF